MTAASGLASGRQASPELAAEAVRAALASAGLSRAEQVILLLTRDFARHPQPAILAAARAAGTLQVGGATVSGLFTETGWQIDQPGAAALVLADLQAPGTGELPMLSWSAHRALPYPWHSGPSRIGLLDDHSTSWSNGRLAADACAEVRLPGRRGRLALSTGLRTLSEAMTVDQCDAYELRRIGGLPAIDSLRRTLPAEFRGAPPLHLIAALSQPNEPAIAILSANADGSLTLAAPLAAGDQLQWAIRQPLAAEHNMRQALSAAVDARTRPDFALMFSCIGRGPLFYGGEDRDLVAFRETFPGTPLLGAYGSGQIVPTGARNRLFQNAVITLLVENSDV